MKEQDFNVTLTVDANANETFNAINNVRGWWSEDIEGGTEKFGDQFNYHYEDVHFCKMKLVEVIPGQKVVWLVLDNHFNFVKDQNEWIGTKVIFELSENNNQTQIHFTHQGLVPDYECYNICRDAWTNYITTSLRSLILTGKGQPNPKGGRNPYQEALSQKMNKQDHTTIITVDASAQETFRNINHVSKWWTENLEGSSQKLNDEFTVRFGDVHVSTQKIIEWIPDEKVVWLVTDSTLNFIQDKHEWTNTKISFEISRKDDKTQIKFTHIGLLPGIECYGACSNAWDQYIKGSLFKLLTEGKGKPELSAMVANA